MLWLRYLAAGAILAYSGLTSTGSELQSEPPHEQTEPAQKEMSARDAFWSVQDLVVPPALRYSVLKRTKTGEYEEVASNTTFHAGDFIRLKVTSNQDGYLYIINRGSSGKWHPLFPAAGTTGTNRVMKFKPITVPATEKKAWTFTGTPGQENVFILLTRTPQNDLDKNIASLQSDEKGIEPPFIDKIRGEVKDKDLKETDPDQAPAANGKPDHAAYVANMALHVVVDVVLSYR